MTVKSKIKNQYKSAKRGMKLYWLLKEKFGKKCLVVLGSGREDLDISILENIKTKSKIVYLTTYNIKSENVLVYNITEEDQSDLLSYYSFITFDDKFKCLNVNHYLCGMFGKIIDSINYDTSDIAKVLLKGIDFD